MEATVSKRILIVEDNFDNREIYAEILRHAGYDILEAENGMRGVEKALEHLPDIILMDLSMPLMDGWEAIAVLKGDSRTAAIPVLAVSAHVVMNGDYRRAEAAGFSSYITKPVEPKEVLREVRTRIGPPHEGVEESSDL
jgi:two-component system, cell cycle response regulator DivK